MREGNQPDWAFSPAARVDNRLSGNSNVASSPLASRSQYGITCNRFGSNPKTRADFCRLECRNRYNVEPPVAPCAPPISCCIQCPAPSAPPCPACIQPCRPYPPGPPNIARSACSDFSHTTTECYPNKCGGNPCRWDNTNCYNEGNDRSGNLVRQWNTSCRFARRPGGPCCQVVCNNPNYNAGGGMYSLPPQQYPSENGFRRCRKEPIVNITAGRCTDRDLDDVIQSNPLMVVPIVPKKQSNPQDEEIRVREVTALPASQMVYVNRDYKNSELLKTPRSVDTSLYNTKASQLRWKASQRQLYYMSKRSQDKGLASGQQYKDDIDWRQEPTRKSSETTASYLRKKSNWLNKRKDEI